MQKRKDAAAAKRLGGTGKRSCPRTGMQGQGKERQIKPWIKKKPNIIKPDT